MTKTVIGDEIKQSIHQFLEQNQSAELVSTYLHFVEAKWGLKPVLFPKEKMIFQSADDTVKYLEKENKLWHEAEITINFSNQINDQTKRIYICPFTGKVFGDNTHPNPQDAIYDWLSKCPENKERIGGLPVKRFFISEDPEIIKNYIAKIKQKDPIRKIVFSSVINGKLFNTKEAVIKDFKNNYLKSLSLVEVQSQNKFQIEEHFLAFIQKHLVEDKIGAFIEALSEHDEFAKVIAQWLE